MASICRFEAFEGAAGYLFGHPLKSVSVAVLRGHFLSMIEKLTRLRARVKIFA